MPEGGERYQDSGMLLANEWTGKAWTSVCPIDDVALTTRDEGWLCCPVCGRRHYELSEWVKAQRK